MNQLIIHDLENLPFKAKEYHIVFPAQPNVLPCTGCFGCWLKTPGVCVIEDRAQPITELISKTDEVIIISECVYGGYSPSVKTVMDRCIGYLLPYFRIIDNEMHHQLRYNTPVKLSLHFYGPTTEEERIIAQDLIKSNALNFGCKEYEIHFYQDQKEISL